MQYPSHATILLILSFAPCLLIHEGVEMEKEQSKYTLGFTHQDI